MPCRLVRDDMLDSERLQTLPVEARWLYVVALLVADDVGLFEVSPFKLGRRAGIDMQKIPVLVTLLVDSDLIRCYEVAGKRFAFIPRYGQRLQIKRSKHPAPPASLLTGDDDAIRKFNDLAEKARLSNGGSQRATVAQRSEPEPEPTETENPIRTARADVGNSKPTDAGLTCRAMKAVGISDPNPGHPDLLMLLEAGATEAEFVGAAQGAVKKGKGFAYAIGALVAQRKDAAEKAAAVHRGPLPGSPESLRWHETRGGVEKRALELGMPKWDEMVPFDRYKARVMKASEQAA